jgi:MFS family permease
MAPQHNRRVRLPRIFEPLKVRDFALLWSGMTVSMLGDRFFVVAMAWETYTLSNDPLALGLVAACSTTPVLLFVIFGGVLTDRFERRHMMVASDLIRAGSIGTIGWLALSGNLQLWELALLVAVAGIGSALFLPAFSSIVPDLVPGELLPQANALASFVRLGVGLGGPALAGLVVATAGPGWAFVADAVSYAASTTAALALAPRPIEKKERAFKREVLEGFAFVRRTPWLFGSLLASLPLNVATAASMVLLPFIVKNGVQASAGALGLVYSARAVGGLVGSYTYGHRGVPRHHVVVMYLGWVVSTAATMGFGLAGNVSMLVALALVGGGGSAVGQAIWGTMMHTLVPNELLGRVYSLDHLTAVAVIPAANAGSGIVASAVGARATLAFAGAFSAAATLLFLVAWPGMRASERDGSMRRSGALA